MVRVKFSLLVIMYGLNASKFSMNAFRPENELPPVQVITCDIGRSEVRNIVVDHHDLPVITAVPAGKQVGGDLDLLEELHLTPV